MRNGDYTLVLAPSPYPGTKYRGKYCYEHILVWWGHTGGFPGAGEVIHHKNGNKRDNRFENLELKRRSVHSSEHNSERGKLVVELACPTCGKIFYREKRNTKNKVNFCSRRCVGRHIFKQHKCSVQSENFIVKEIRVFQRY